MKENKDKYRKRPYTPKFKRPFSSEAGNFLRKLLKISPGKKEKFKQDSFAKNSDLEVIYLANYFKPETVSFLIDMGDKGANLTLLLDMVYFCRSFSRYNKDVEELNIRKKYYIKREKAIRGAVKLLCNLKPIPNLGVDDISDFNRKVGIMQGQIRTLMETYFKLMPLTHTPLQPWTPLSLVKQLAFRPKLSPQQLMKIKSKHIQQSSGFWNGVIMMLVDEFKRIGFSNKQAYIKTAEFLNIASPDIYKDKDPDLVRQRYSYHSKKNPP